MSKTYEPIATQTLVSNTATVTFSSIPSSWTDLVLTVTGYGTVNDRVLHLRFNGVNTGTLYSVTRLIGYSAGAYSDRIVNANQLQIASNWSDVQTSTTIAHILSYANTNVFKTVLTETTDNSESVGRHVGLFRSTNAISSIELFVDSGNLVSGTTISLYGIKAESPVLPLLTESTKTTSSVSAIISNYDAGLTYTVASTAGTATRSTNTVTVSGLTEGQNIILTVTATDGNNSSAVNTISLTSDTLPTGGTITTSGGYRYHTFTGSGTFTVPSTKTMDYVIVGGGGGGHSYWSGGGGGGGVVESLGSSIVAGTYSIIVGSGGSGSSSNGNSSSFNSVAALGGGLGGAPRSAGSSGASGGGGGMSVPYASPYSFAGGTSTSPTQGNSGGSSFSYPSSNPQGSSTTHMGGGGGGAGSVGTSGSPNKTPAATPGGSGKTVFAGTFGGGGGGLAFDGRQDNNPYIASSPVPGGGGISSGGVFGINQTSATSGATNTGGGGGAGYLGSWPAGGWTGGNGGSGIVVIRYPV